MQWNQVERTEIAIFSSPGQTNKQCSPILVDKDSMLSFVPGRASNYRRTYIKCKYVNNQLLCPFLKIIIIYLLIINVLLFIY